MKKIIILSTLFISSIIKSYSCHESGLEELSMVQNDDGTYTYVYELCMGEFEETYGFELTFTGYFDSVTTILNPTTSITDPYSGVTLNITSNSGNFISYGEYSNASGIEPMFHRPADPAVCFNLSFTFDQPIISSNMFGTELTYSDGPCDVDITYLDSSVCLANFFTTNPGDICVGEEIQFINRSYSKNGYINDVIWEVDGNQISTDSLFNISFDSAGNHSLRLFMQDLAKPCTDDTVYNIVVKGFNILNDLPDTIFTCTAAAEMIEFNVDAEVEGVACDLILVMNDGYGDGWIDGFVTVQNGAVSTNYSSPDHGLFAQSTSDTAFISVVNGTNINISYTPPTNYNDEVSFELFDSQWNSLYSVSAPSAGNHFNQVWTCEGVTIDYAWTFSDTVITVDSFGYQLGVGDLVYLELSNSDISCTYLDTISINSYSSALNLGLDTTLCINQEYSIVLDIDADSIVWSDGSLSDSLKISETGVYWAQTYKNGCVALDSINVIFEDTPFVFAGVDTTIFQDSSYILQGEISDEIISYYWNDNQGIFTKELFLNPEVKLTEVTDFYLYGETANGCFAYDTVTINVKENEVVVENCDLLIPTAFTPNNDGVNDLWNIVNIDCYSDYKLTVFNRWGTKVYEGKSGWSGDDLPSASYFYLLNYTDLNNEEVTKQGALTIIR